VRTGLYNRIVPFISRARPKTGMLLQVDASRHDWLRGRGPHLTLVGARQYSLGFLEHSNNHSHYEETIRCWTLGSDGMAIS
jgi:hypothetical protein